jgi:hypothetical protein
MGFFSRLLVPRGVRRAVYPMLTVKRAVTAKPVKRERRALHPVSNASAPVTSTTTDAADAGATGTSGWRAARRRPARRPGAGSGRGDAGAAPR